MLSEKEMALRQVDSQHSCIGKCYSIKGLSGIHISILVIITIFMKILLLSSNDINNNIDYFYLRNFDNVGISMKSKLIYTVSQIKYGIMSIAGMLAEH